MVPNRSDTARPHGRRAASGVHAPLSRALRDLHRALLHVEAADGARDDPFALLDAVMRDPRFAWLRPLTEAIVALDEAGDAGDLAEPAGLVPFRGRIEALIGPAAASDAAFRDGFLRALQSSPDVVIATRDVRAHLRAIALH